MGFFSSVLGFELLFLCLFFVLLMLVLGVSVSFCVYFGLKSYFKWIFIPLYDIYIYIYMLSRAYLQNGDAVSIHSPKGLNVSTHEKCIQNSIRQ